MRSARIAAWIQDATRRTLPPREAYARWAPTYPARAHNPLMMVEQDAIAALIGSTRASRALDVGTGSGRYLPVLRAAGARLAVGLDWSPAMLGAQTPDTPRVCGDARRLPVRTASMDLVCSSLMVGDLEDVGEWLAEAGRVLAPGGHVIYSDFHESWRRRRWRRTFRGADGRLYEIRYCSHTIDEHLRALAQHGFEVRAIREPRLTPPPSGRRLPGWSRSATPAAGVPVVVIFHAVKTPAARPAAGITPPTP